MEEYERKIHTEQISIITKRILEEENSIHVVNTCFQPFESSNESRFVFYRTDPLFLSQVVNFDVALFSSDYNTICLIECKSSLRKNVVSTVNEFQKKIDFVEKNSWVNVGGKQMKIINYFAETLNIENPNFYYVLASEIVDWGASFDEGSFFDKIVEVSDHPFDMWRCQWVFKGGIKITRNPIPSKHNREKRISIVDFTTYLSKVHSSAGNSIQICLSSNKYYLAVHSCMNLRGFESFKFDDFLTSFSIDLKDYEEFEKEYLFEHFINFGKECSFLKVLEDTGDVFTSSYAIINRRTKSKQLRKNIIAKMVDQKVESDPEVKKRIKEEEKSIIQEIFYEREPRQRKLTEFADQDD